MKLYTNFIYPTEVHDVVKLFLNDVVLSEDCHGDITLVEYADDAKFKYVSTFFARVSQCEVDVSGLDELQQLRLRKRFAKVCMYDVLVKVTGKHMPWGSLTGIRPTKLARQITAEGLDWKQTFADLFDVSDDKIKLVDDIICEQGDLYAYRANTADLYVGIPFCVSRCSYCSFTSGEIGRMKQYVEPYVAELKREISRTLDFADKNGITLRNVYFGGGTPTSLSAAQLDEVLSQINFVPTEYTVEAGRPDTVDKDKLDVFAAHGVNRISINPQTFNQSVLDVIGRKHTVADIYDKYNLARGYDFDINMDLIAGLPTETYEMFCHSVDCAIECGADNITVHTLALKHGSVLKEQNYDESHNVCKMVSYAHARLYKAGYVPYYMYRQKYMSDNLENVGFTKRGKPCLYNIDIMEEISDIIACGTNAVSKRVLPSQNRIERAANPKDVITYIQRLDDFLQKKFELFGADGHVEKNRSKQ